MARWEPRTPLESMQANVKRVDARIESKKKEVKELENQKRQLEQAIKAMSSSA